MSKSTNKKTKTKKGEQSSKKINWLPIVIVLVCIFVCTGLGFGISAIAKKAKAKNLDVAFYQLPETIKEELEKRINDSYSGKIKIVDITGEDFDARKIARRYDLVFTWKGNAASKLERYAEDLPGEWYSEMPTSLRRQAGKFLPIAIDHYEISYHRDKRIEADLNFPQSIVEFQSYLEKMRSYTFSPFFANGSNDDTLLALVSAFVEGFGGTESYNLFIQNTTKKPTLAQTIDMQLSVSGNAKDEFTLRSILDVIRGWQTKGVTHPNWFIAKQGDVDAFLEDDQVSVLFMPLSVHRTMRYKLVSKMDADRMPVFSVRDDHGLIAPEIIGLKLTDYDYFDDVLANLITEKAQKEICNITKLGPVNARCQAYDRQSDDVRFLAASCKDGPLPPLGLAVFQTNEAAKHKYAEEVRTYLKSGIVGGENK